MSPKTLSGNPESSREEAGVEQVISNLRLLFDEAITPNIEKGLRKLTEPTLRMLEKLLNPDTNGTKEMMFSRLMSVLNKQ